MDKLRKCPFCGGEAELLIYRNYAFQETYIIVCQQCRMRCECSNHLIEKWNTRYEPPTPDGAIVPAGNARLKK